MVQIYLIRHGETDYNKQNLVQGHTDILLNACGISQAEQAADYFKSNNIRFDHVYASPLMRAYKTAAVVSGWEMDKIITDVRIQEMSFGVAEGIEYHAAGEGFMNLFKQPELYVLPDGAESIEALQERSKSFLEDIKKWYKEGKLSGNILVASHGAAIRGMISQITGSDRKDFWITGLSNCCIVPVILDEKGFHMDKIIDPIKK